MEKIPIIRPTLPPVDKLMPKLQDAFTSGQITNARFVREFEEKAKEYLGVSNAIAISSCTNGLILVEKCLGLKGEVIVPSFTFCATAHSLVWNQIKPVFVDSERASCQIDPSRAELAITDNTSAILAVHIFGTPCDIESLQTIADRHGLKLIFDSAHGFGAVRRGRPLGGFGDAEVFSLSPTKLLVAGEGGLVATNDDELARKIRIGRDYGNPGDYNCEFIGLNARMSELHAILALETIDELDRNISRRNEIAAFYREKIDNIEGLSYQKVDSDDTSSYKDFSILVGDGFRLSRDSLASKLLNMGIETRPYFYPPVHKQNAYAYLDPGSFYLPEAEYLSERSLSIPLYSHMSDGEAERVILALEINSLG